MEHLAQGLGIVTGITALILSFKMIFRDSEDFFDCLKFWLMPDIISLFRGEYMDDYFSELKLGLWLGLGIGGGFATSMGITYLMQ